jgi:hypothetical protein
MAPLSWTYHATFPPKSLCGANEPPIHLLCDGKPDGDDEDSHAIVTIQAGSGVAAVSIPPASELNLRPSTDVPFTRSTEVYC